MNVLGGVRVARADDAGEPAWLDLGARKPRSIVAALALHVGRPVTADALADLVWAGEPPRAAHGALHAYISGLRKVLEPERASRAAASVLETTDHGYVLRVAADDVDAHRFVTDVRRLERTLAPLATQLTAGGPAGWPDRAAVTAALEHLDTALASWGGQPYADLEDHPDVVAERAALEQARVVGEQSWLLGLLALGEHASALSTTESRIAANPLQERWWALHALALTRSGRQAEALDSLRAVRELLADELGLDPGVELRELERAILQQDAGLERTLDAAVAAPGPTPAAARPASAPASTSAVGRETERAALHAHLASAAAGTPTCAVLVGEPGIGKTWLLTDLEHAAAGQGFHVARGTCSQDEGAPPLWPWLGVLRSLGLPPPEAAPTDESPARAAFETADRIATALLDLAADQPVLVVLDDLHWADDATLRTLRHLVSVLPAHARLCLVGSRRSHPEPTGALAEVGEALARRGALRVDLGGLDLAESRALVVGVTGAEVAAATAADWHRRAAGNPFFLAELARLSTSPGGDEVPGGVRDVVARRLADLPPRALDTLRLAAVVGSGFRAETIAAAGDLDLDDVLDDLEAARASGLVDDAEVGDFTFVHALTRDAVRLSLSPTRRARLHAQVAHALDSDPVARRWYSDAELTAERAWHWLRGGPSHLDTAWRAARGAADQARDLGGYPDAMRLRVAAVDAHRRMAAEDESERYDLLLELAADASYAGHWPEVEAAAFEAVALARRLGSPERVGRAAAALSLYCVWLPHELDAVFEDTIEDLRWALAHAAPDDAATRCRLQLALAVELYYAPTTSAERRALVETGLAQARRSGEPAVLWWATRAAWMAAWSPGQATDRAAWAAEGLAAAREVGDRAAASVLLVTLAVSELELGRRDDFLAHLAEGQRIAEEERLPYVLLTVYWLRMSLATIQDDDAGAERAYQGIADTAPDVAVPMQELQAAAAATMMGLWDPPRLRQIVDLMVAAHEEFQDAATTVHQMLARCGRTEDLRTSLARYPIPHEDDEYWSTVADWCSEAEAASAVGDRGVAAHAVEVLAPYSGRMAVSGAVLTLGPVDGYLALALVTLGETERAGLLADAALTMAAEWGFTAYVAWLRGCRERLAF